MSQASGGYYLPEPSKWPIIGSIGIFLTLFGFATALPHNNTDPMGNMILMYIGMAVIMMQRLRRTSVRTVLYWLPVRSARRHSSGLLTFSAAQADTVVLNPVLDNTLFDPECEKSNGIGEFPRLEGRMHGGMAQKHQ